MMVPIFLYASLVIGLVFVLKLISLLQTLPYQYPSPTWMDTNGLSFEESYQVPQEYYQEIPQPVYLTL